MRKSYLAEIIFDDESIGIDGGKVDLRWPDGSKFDPATLDGPFNENNQLVQEFLFRGVSNRYGIGVRVIEEVR
jgi:hypothetical protein